MQLSDFTKNVPYIVNEEDSDDHGALSSDEDDEMMTFNEDLDEDSDDFDKEMNAEIQQSMPIALKKKTAHKTTKKAKEDKFYDDIYFNSSDEEDVSIKKEDKKVKTNEELFYDPCLDDRDEMWMTNKRKNYLKPGNKEKPKDNEEPGASSATLSCPACMTVLCKDCQQHETYHNQFRAMFVFNCLVLPDEKLTYELKENKKSRKRKKGSTVDEIPSMEDYNPVKCAVCQTKVAVFDKDEIYHFFNVLAT